MVGILSESGVFTGRIISSGSLSGSITSSGILVGTMALPTTVPLPTYEGSYSVIPKVISQTLDTNLKSMYDDIEVTSIPYYEVSNPHGGSTIIIGGND